MTNTTTIESNVQGFVQENKGTVNIYASSPQPQPTPTPQATPQAPQKPQIYALLLGNGSYTDSTINPLPKATHDVTAMQQILTTPHIGRIPPENVSAPLNLTLREAKRVISDFFGNRQRENLLIFYYSGHGLRDREGRLYLAMQDTTKQYLIDEALPVSFIAEKMSQSRAKSQIIILDCCYSGAFKPAPDAKAVDLTAVVLTASDITEAAWEDDDALKNSLFTHHLVEGLKSPLTDKNGDGLISVDDRVRSDLGKC